MRRNTDPIRTGGLNDPVARSIRNEQQRDAAPHPDELAAKAEREKQIIERLAELAGENLFLEDRDAVASKADDRDWSDVVSAANDADDQQWSFYVSQALTVRENCDSE
jgi:hypothetical protein